MPLPQAQAAVDDMRLAHRELLRVVDSLSDAEWARLVPYGEWTVKDLIAHLVGDMSPSGPGLILAGVLTPEFIADTSKTFDVRPRNAAIVAQRAGLPREDLRQLLFASHDAMIEAALKLEERHLPVLAYTVPMGPEYQLRVEDWLWFGFHDRQHADDIRRARDVDYAPEKLSFVPEVQERTRFFVRTQDGFLRAVYSVADDAWEEGSEDCPGWTYHDLLAHVASNEARLQTRFRSATGKASQSDLDAVNDVDAWNRQRVEERRGRSLRELVDEFVEGRQGTLKVLAGLRPEHVHGKATVSGGEQVPLLEFMDRVAAHTSRHAGQLVPASRARRWQAAA